MLPMVAKACSASWTTSGHGRDRGSCPASRRTFSRNAANRLSRVHRAGLNRRARRATLNGAASVRSVGRGTGGTSRSTTPSSSGSSSSTEGKTTPTLPAIPRTMARIPRCIQPDTSSG